MPQKLRRAEAIWFDNLKRWQINVQCDGIRKTFTSSIPGRKGKHDAENKADDWLESQSESRRFDQAWGVYIKDYEKRVGRAAYIKTKGIGDNWILPNVRGKLTLDKLTPAVWQKCIDDAAAEGLSLKSCSNIRAVIMAFCDFCRRNRWELDVPDVREIKLPKDAARPQRKILQPNGFQTLFSVSTIEHYHKQVECWYIHLWRLMVLTGMRRGEAVALRREDVEGNVLHISRSVNNLMEMTDGKTANATRYVTLSSKAHEVLAEQAQMLRKAGIVSPWLFPARDGDMSNPNDVYKAWYTYRNQHGLECSLHELRHTFISAVKSDLPMALLREQVGHSTQTDSIGIYGHSIEGDAAATAAVLDDVFARLIK